MSRYSFLYIDQPSPLPDSPRARRRLGKLTESLCQRDTPELSEFLDGELGIPIKLMFAQQWPDFYKASNIRDILDVVTITHSYLNKRASLRPDLQDLRVSAGLWKETARRVFEEERLAYEIDDNCVVHPFVDKEFQRNRYATVAALGLPRYANSLSTFQRISDELSKQPPNGKDAWRAVFTSVEGLFRLMFPSASQLNVSVVETNLVPLVQKLLFGDPVALRAANKQLASFKDWIDSSHNYRHEPGSEEMVQPPLDLAILAISNGASFLRWLIALDQARIVSG